MTAWTLAVKSATVNPPGAMARARAADRAARARGWLRSIPPTRVAPIRGQGQLVEETVGEESDVDAVQHGGEAIHHRGKTGHDLRELLQHPAAASLGGVVQHRLEAQYVLVFDVPLQGHEPEVDPEEGEVPPRSLDHDLLRRREISARLALGAVADAEQGAELGHIQARSGTVDDGLEEPLHLPRPTVSLDTPLGR